MQNDDRPIVHKISLGVVAAYAVVDREAILVDTGDKPDARRLLAGLRRCEVEPTDVRLIVLTHGHSDHCTGAAAAREATGAPVAIHRLDVAALREGRDRDLDTVDWRGRLLLLMAAITKPRIPTFAPDLLIEDELDLTPYGVRGRAVWTPGHTQGAISVVLEGGEAVVGDMAMARALTSGGPTRPPFAADLGQLTQSAQRLHDLGVKRVYVGHGGPFDLDEVIRVIG